MNVQNPMTIDEERMDKETVSCISIIAGFFLAFLIIALAGSYFH